MGERPTASDRPTVSSSAFSDRVTTSATERNKQRLSLKLLPNFVWTTQWFDAYWVARVGNDKLIFVTL